jgi:hypothetical protein
MEELPVNSGGFGDVWRGVYDGQRVAIKGLRIYKENDIREIKRVGCDDPIFLPSFTSLILGVLQGGCSVETVLAPQHCPIPRSL